MGKGGFCMRYILIFTLLVYAEIICALTIADFPVPFVENGKANLLIVVGDDAASSDVLSAVDIALFVQKSATTKKPVVLNRVKPLLSGDAVALGSGSDFVEINETLGTVRESLTEVDLNVLKGGFIVTQEGSTEYNQYLRLPKDRGSGRVEFKETGGPRSVPRIVLSYSVGTPIFTWELEFEDGLRSRVENHRLVDVEDKEIFVLGKPFVIVNAKYEGNTDFISLRLLGGVVSSFLGEGDEEAYMVNGKEYTVEVVIVSETGEGGEGSVKFRINGELTAELKKGDTDFLADGLVVAVKEITPSKKNVQKSMVEFYLGAETITFSDQNATDGASNPASTKVNQEALIYSAASIQGAVANDTVVLKKINYTLYASTLTGGANVAPGKTVRSTQRVKEGFLTDAWDITFLGLHNGGKTLVVFDPTSDHSYHVQFTNQEGIFYDIPLLTNEQTKGTIKYGDSDDDLWFCEPINNTMYAITRNDLFVLSNCDASTSDNTCLSHVFRYDSLSTLQHVLELTDFGVGKRHVVFDNTTRQGMIVTGGVEYQVFVDPLAPYNLSIDLNGNRNVSNNDGCVYVGIQGDGLILLGNNNTNETVLQGGKTFVGTNATNVTILTLGKEFDESGQNENITVQIEGRANNQIGIQDDGVRAASGGMFGLFTPPQNKQKDMGLSLYGVMMDLFDPPSDGSAETLTLMYPLAQEVADVYVTEAPFSPLSDDGEVFAETVNRMHEPIGVLASEVKDITKENAIVVGGPCANSVSAVLLGQQKNCVELFEKTSALLQLFTHDTGKVSLVVAGRTAEQTQLVSQLLLLSAKEYAYEQVKLSRTELLEKLYELKK